MKKGRPSYIVQIDSYCFSSLRNPAWKSAGPIFPGPQTRSTQIRRVTSSCIVRLEPLRLLGLRLARAPIA